MKPENIKTSLIIFFLAVLFFSCDNVDDDQLPVNEITDFDSETFLTPGTLAIIDISKGVETNQALKLSIANAPNFGRLEYFNGPFLKYLPNGNFSEGQDFFNIEIKSATDEFLGNKKVRITVSRDSTDLPCTLIAFADYARTPINQPLLLDVLKNDWDCDPVTIDSTSLTIKHQPTAGQATVVGSEIRFDPAPEFMGIAEFIYSVSSLDESVISHAVVQVQVGKDTLVTCHFQLADDSVSYNHETDSALFIYALQNDSLCDKTIQNVAISNQPTFGEAAVIPTDTSSWVFNYKLTTTPTSGIDQFTYQVCDEAECYQASVFIIFSDCLLRANQDYFVINSDSSIYTNNNYPLDVLVNDQYCDSDSLQLRVLTQTSNGQVSIGNRQLIYTTNLMSNHTDSLIYEICNGTQLCDSAKVFINFQ